MVRELLTGKCFANCYGNVILYDESSPNNPFRVSYYDNMSNSSPMDSEWDEFNQKIWVEIQLQQHTDDIERSYHIDVRSISIMANKGEFTKFTLDNGIELEFNHTDNTLHFRPVTPSKQKSSIKDEEDLEHQLIEALRKIVKLEITVKALIQDLEKAEQMNTRLRIVKFMHFNDEECWVWNSDDPNHVESLV
ncbi:hypothetical protein, partial [Thermofilum sp.]|uniref:hypothetical protein n=1 Tax=Thermofilum sp. TaxID=1961369 RepID=UPI00258A8E55